MPASRLSAVDVAWLVGCVVASSLWCISSAQRTGATFDEPTYIAAGLAGWRDGAHGRLLSLGTMPLAIDWQTWPLRVAETWRGAPIDPAGELHQWLPWARRMTLAFWAMLLVYAWLIGRRLAGAWGGRIAATVVACEPNLLAHASLATTDLALAACVVATLYHFERGRRSEHWRVRVGVPALWAAAAVLAKASAVVFLPLCFLAIELARLAADGTLRRASGEGSLAARGGAFLRSLCPLARDYLQVSLIACVLVVVYCGSDWKTEEDFVAWARELPAGRGAAMVWVAEHLRIFPNAGEALVRQVKHNLHGHAMYIAGRSGQRGVWYYFPLLLCWKLPLPLLACAIALPLAARRAAWSWPLCCAATLLAYSFSFRVQIGVRMVLPLVALLAIAVAIALVRWQAAAQTRSRRWRQGLVAATMALMFASALRALPHGLCYANALAGGAAGSYRLVSDSNYDWGQGVPDLLRWQRQRGLERLDVWYFGADPQADAPTLRRLPLHCERFARADGLLREMQGRYLAVGATVVHGGYITPDAAQPGADMVRLLRSQTPIDRAGPFLIYDLSQHPRWAEARRGAELQANSLDIRADDRR